MDGELRAKTSQMRDAAQTIQNSAQRISDSIESVDAEIRALSVDRFTSIAAEEFRARYMRLTPRLKDAAKNLVQFQQRLSDAANEIELASRPTE
ncbi:MAG: WXG100 family type VII secretion target [Anaerolineae bacterium]|nr:WXG100 family type VII secretion target [Anaerolineae bacterium]MDQ7037245.1 WXG100 family type VII secretion target [Anaerolineae bacterium]